MKKSIVFMTVLLLLGFTSIVLADKSANTEAHVYLEIAANIAVDAIDGNVDASSLQTGEVTVPITFRVDANTEAVTMSVLVTKLYKGDDPNGTEVLPIDPSGGGVQIDPVNANEMNGGDGFLAWATAGTFTNEKGTFEGPMTEVAAFESSQNGHFSQEVEVIAKWINEDNEKPVGQYSGYVVLYAAVVE